MDQAYETFGPQRMMWGSAYPPVGGRGSYHNSLPGVLELPLLKTQEEKDWAFGKTAAKAFNWINRERYVT